MQRPGKRMPEGRMGNREANFDFLPVFRTFYTAEPVLYTFFFLIHPYFYFLLDFHHLLLLLLLLITSMVFCGTTREGMARAMFFGLGRGGEDDYEE